MPDAEHDRRLSQAACRKSSNLNEQSSFPAKYATLERSCYQGGENGTASAKISSIAERRLSEACVKLGSYACDLARVRDNGVLEPRFPCLAWAHIVRSRTREHRRRSKPIIKDSIVSSRATANEIEPGRAGVYVEACHSQSVIVVPDSRGAIAIRVLKGRKALSRCGAKSCRGLAAKRTGLVSGSGSAH
jgi:hypothetical protein